MNNITKGILLSISVASLAFLIVGTSLKDDEEDTLGEFEDEAPASPKQQNIEKQAKNK